METMKTETYIDKSAWSRGPWSDEPDKCVWIDAATGLDCMIVRHTHSGHLCGYVGLPPGHYLHGVAYSGCPKNCGDAWCEHRPETIVHVHGGLTYSDRCQGKVCHEPEPGRPHDVWWFGFDCAHSGDESPCYRARRMWDDAVYRTIDYVRAECRALAAALAEARQ